MSFKKMKESLTHAYERNVQAVRLQQLIRDGHEIPGAATPPPLRIPVLSGWTGIGKTACVKAFATEQGFDLIKLDCSYMKVNYLAFHMHTIITRLLSGELQGCVILIDNINAADRDWKALFDQYANHYFDFPVKVADAANPDQVEEIQQRFESIPEGLFIVGEQRPD